MYLNETFLHYIMMSSIGSTYFLYVVMSRQTVVSIICNMRIIRRGPKIELDELFALASERGNLNYSSKS